MISKLMIAALLLPAFGWAQAKVFCTQPQIAGEAQIFMRLKMQTGNQFVGSCLNQAINEKIFQKFSEGQKIQINLITIEQTVREILDDERQALETAQVKAEIFELGLDVNGDRFTHADREMLDADADQKREASLEGIHE